MPTTYPTELKIKTIRRYEKGESIKALSQELHISQSTLYQWRKEYCSIEMPNRTYTPAEFDAMARRLKKLEHYIAIIHQSGYLSSVPLQKKLATLEELYNRPDNPYSVHELVMRWELQEEPSTTTSSAEQIAASMRRSSRRNSC